MKNRIYLRALEPEDYKISIKWRKDDEIWSMLGGHKYFVSEAYEKQWVLNQMNSSDIKLAICTIDENLYIGNAYLTDLDFINRSAQSHILIGNHDYWGAGYATEAMRLLLDFAFNERGLNRISAYILESNVGSQKVHEKLGYKKEGVLRNSIFKEGLFQSQIIYGLLREDYYK